MILSLTHDEEVELEEIHKARTAALQSSYDEFNKAIEDLNLSFRKETLGIWQNKNRRSQEIDLDFIRLKDKFERKTIIRRWWSAVYMVLTLAAKPKS